jgi:hypothetical protein
LIKQRQCLKGLTPILKEVLVSVECYQTASHAAQKPCAKVRVNRFGKLPSFLILRNRHSHRNLQQPVSSHQQRGKTLHQQKDYDSLKVQMMVIIFNNKVIF